MTPRKYQVGRFEIETIWTPLHGRQWYFELFARNGVSIYFSGFYSSKQACQKGIAGLKRNVLTAEIRK